MENLNYGFDADSDGDDNDPLLFNLCEEFTSGSDYYYYYYGAGDDGVGLCTLVSETRQNSKKLVSLFTRGRINFAERISL